MSHHDRTLGARVPRSSVRIPAVRLQERDDDLAFLVGAARSEPETGAAAWPS